MTKSRQGQRRGKIHREIAIPEARIICSFPKDCPPQASSRQRKAQYWPTLNSPGGTAVKAGNECLCRLGGESQEMDGSGSPEDFMVLSSEAPQLQDPEGQLKQMLW